jgi:tetratricopeptide (TPR) repeat protein
MEVVRPQLTRSLWLAAIAAACSGCLGDLNRGHYDFHFRTGLTALENHNYEGARRQFGFAYWYATAGCLGPEAEAASLYNEGMASGHAGRFVEAEGLLKRALELDRRTGANQPELRVKRLVELARLYQAWAKPEEAAAAYGEALSLARKLKVDRAVPVDFAIVIEDYAVELDALGRTAEAADERHEAAEIRATNPERQPKFKVQYYGASDGGVPTDRGQSRPTAQRREGSEAPGK